jgi:hypothetical protein
MLLGLGYWVGLSSGSKLGFGIPGLQHRFRLVLAFATKARILCLDSL